MDYFGILSEEFLATSPNFVTYVYQMTCSNIPIYWFGCISQVYTILYYIQLCTVLFSEKKLQDSFTSYDLLLPFALAHFQGTELSAVDNMCQPCSVGFYSNENSTCIAVSRSISSLTHMKSLAIYWFYKMCINSRWGRKDMYNYIHFIMILSSRHFLTALQCPSSRQFSSGSLGAAGIQSCLCPLGFEPDGKG